MISVMPEGETLFSEKCTHVKIVDEAGGEFIEIVQQSGHINPQEQTIQINDREEWEAICNAVGMIWECIDASEVKEDQ
jgi:hypothetical protein